MMMRLLRWLGIVACEAPPPRKHPTYQSEKTWYPCPFCGATRRLIVDYPEEQKTSRQCAYCGHNDFVPYPIEIIQCGI